MTTETIYECHVTGETYRALNFVYEFEVRYHGDDQNPFDVRDRTVHVALKALDEHDVEWPIGLEYVGVEDGRVVGAAVRPSDEHSSGRPPEWCPRERAADLEFPDGTFYPFVETRVSVPGVLDGVTTEEASP